MGAIDGLPTSSQVQSLYAGYFNRGADHGGLTYWATAMTNDPTTWTLSHVAASFADQSESRATYAFLQKVHDGVTPTSQDIDDFIVQIYNNAFNRNPDSAGQTYWHNYLANNLTNLDAIGGFIVSVMNGAAVGGADDLVQQREITAGNDWTSRTSAAGLGNSGALPAHFIQQGHVMTVTAKANSVAAAATVTTNYINNGPH